MGMSTSGSGISGGRRRRGGRRHAMMSEINVTPFVDVMLVLLIIFMVAAPLLSVGIETELPQSKARQVTQSEDAVSITIDESARIFLGETEVSLAELPAKIAAISEARDGLDTPIEVKGYKGSSYEIISRVLGDLSNAGFKEFTLRHVPLN